PKQQNPRADQKGLWLSEQRAFQVGHLLPFGWIGPLSRSMKNCRNIPEEAIYSPAAMKAQIPTQGWCRAAMAISMARLPSGARTAALAPCLKSAPMGC